MQKIVKNYMEKNSNYPPPPEISKIGGGYAVFCAFGIG